MLNICYIICGILTVITVAVGYVLVRRAKIDIVKVAIGGGVILAVLWIIARLAAPAFGEYQVRTATPVVWSALLLMIAGAAYILHDEKDMKTTTRVIVIAIVIVAAGVSHYGWNSTKTFVHEYRVAFINNNTIVGVDEEGKTRSFDLSVTLHSAEAETIEVGEGFFAITGGGLLPFSDHGPVDYITTVKPSSSVGAGAED